MQNHDSDRRPPSSEMMVGVDFGAPRRARDQQKKTVAIAAYSTGGQTYRIDASGFNARLFASEAPGWPIQELLAALLAQPARVVGFDFPFCVPLALLQDPGFAADVEHQSAFETWRAFNVAVAQWLPLTDPLDFTPFAPWRDASKRKHLWAKRTTDKATAAQPPLKDKFQATFQMTLLGNVLLSKLCASNQYRVLPFQRGPAKGDIIEVYPGATLRAMGLANYKSHPHEAVRRCIAACDTAGIRLDVSPQIVSLACRYNSGTSKAPDHDVADAFVALCTAILYTEERCRPALAPDAREWELEGAIWVPTIS